MPQLLQHCYFIESQGYPVFQSILCQDSKSIFTLKQNWIDSSSKRNKEIKVQYVFIKDKIANGEVMVEYCPTKKMWLDILRGYLLFRF